MPVAILTIIHTEGRWGQLCATCGETGVGYGATEQYGAATGGN